MAFKWVITALDHTKAKLIITRRAINGKQVPHSAEFDYRYRRTAAAILRPARDTVRTAKASPVTWRRGGAQHSTTVVRFPAALLCEGER